MSEAHVDPSGNRQNVSGQSGAHVATASDTLTPVATAAPVSLTAVQLDSGQGKTIIADTVVAKIAAAAAREIDGVHDLVSMGAGASIAGFAGRLTKSDQRATGVSVEVGTREAAVDLNMIVDYGVSIPQLAEGVRQNIIEQIRSMTGLIVKEVNINAADIYFPGEQAAPARVQ